MLARGHRLAAETREENYLKSFPRAIKRSKRPKYSVSVKADEPVWHPEEKWSFPHHLLPLTLEPGLSALIVKVHFLCEKLALWL